MNLVCRGCGGQAVHINSSSAMASCVAPPLFLRGWGVKSNTLSTEADKAVNLPTEALF